MRSTLRPRLAPLVLTLLFAAAGCSHPKLIVKSGNAPAKVLMRVIEDGEGKRFAPDAPHTLIGQTRGGGNKPYRLKWRIPKALLGGRIALRVVFANGERDLQVGLARKRHTRVSVEPPRRVP